MTKTNQVKCDHCGKLFNTQDHRATSVNIKVYDSNSPGWTLKLGTELDVCPDCLRLLARFFHKEEHEL